MQLLIDKGANVCAQTKEQWQPLHSACKWENLEAAVKLIENGADLNARYCCLIISFHL